METQPERTASCAIECADASAAPAMSPRAERKYAQVLDGARAVILARGFDGASVDDIAREAGISKATLYRYFPDKSSLFQAVMQRDCTAQASAMPRPIPDDRPLEDALAEAARGYIVFVTSEQAQSMFRAAVFEAARFPEVGRAFYASQVDRGRACLVPLLAVGVERGEIVVDNLDLAAHRFLALCKAELFLKQLFGMSDALGCEEIETRARGAAAAFMRMYRP